MQTTGGSSRSPWGRAFISLALLVLPLNGLLCRADEGDRRAMECCRGEGARCNAPENMEDCCKGKGSTGNSPTASLASVKKQPPLAAAGAVELCPHLPPIEPSTRAARFPLKFANLLPDATLATPLRI